MKIVQIFNPPLKICKNNFSDECYVENREWSEDVNNNSQVINYVGCYQIEEVWKHYWKQYFISNYGYVVKIPICEQKLLKETLGDEFSKLEAAGENTLGIRWTDFSKQMQNVFKEHAFVPFNRENSGCQICLNITGRTAKYDIHRLVARFFLKKPEDYAEGSYDVHHIDNNSYNNNVTNLIYLKKELHMGKHKIYHPMSSKR